MDIKRLLRKEIPAPLWKRAFAYVLDALVLLLILSPLSSFEVSYNSFSDFLSSAESVFLSFHFFFSVFIVLVLTLAYWTVLDYKFQQTLGKYVFHLKILSETKELTFKQCLLRNIVKLSSLLLFLDVLYMLFHHTNQRYSETLAKTEVVYYG